MERSHYRSAVCLNNYGASLMERGQLRDAVAVMRDSLTIMNSVLQGDSSSGSPPSNSSISDKLHFAAKSMAVRPNAKKNHSSTAIQIVRYDGTASLPVEDSVMAQSYAVTIDDFDNDMDAESQQAAMDVHTAIIVYNTAVARLCLAASIRPRKQQTVVKVSVQLLRWAHAILSRATDQRPSEAIQLNILILGRLSSLLHSAGEHHDACRVSQAQRSLQDTVTAYETVFPVRADLVAAAA
jgi:hypothetical protein